ncbi:MAG: NAD(P)-dependent alcohol dehydrogenase [Actinobacteria bacterium]|nr:NAD(P)-dependent alcohol dehydrogenase [Actinomycetota bacterium]
MESESAPDETMTAVVQDTYGAADVLELRTINHPRIAEDEVLVEVHAAGVDRGVWHLMTGQPYLIRIAGYGLRKPKNPTLGLDLAGRVVAIGADVTRFQPGDDVFGIGNGTYARYATAHQDKLAHKPQNATYEQAAVATVSGITALEALTKVGHLEAGQRVLIVGASGGVGTYAIQLAKALGAEVTGVGGPGSADMMHSIGADHVIDYTEEDFVNGQDQYDLILDIGGRNSISRLRSVLTPKGTLVIVGGEGGNRVTGGVGRQLRAMMLSPFIAQRLTTFISSEHYTNIERLAAHIERGDVVSTIGARFGLADVPVAMRHLESSGSNGKSVIVVRDTETK